MTLHNQEIACFSVAEIPALQLQQHEIYGDLIVKIPFIFEEINPSDFQFDHQNEWYEFKNKNGKKNLNSQIHSKILELQNMSDIHKADAIIQAQIKERLIKKEVRFLLPDTVYLAMDVEISDSIVYGGCFIGKNVKIENSKILSGSHIEEVNVDSGCTIGPNARIRGKSSIGKNSKIGNLAEIKNSTIGHNTSISHVSYVGDAIVGNYVNIGGGTMIANFNGATKNLTIVKDHSFIGANVTLVSPVVCEERSFVAAGSVITQNTPSDCLSIARERQTVIENWKSKYKK